MSGVSVRAGESRPRTGAGTPVCPSEHLFPSILYPWVPPPQYEKTGFPSHPFLGTLRTPVCVSSP